MVSILGPPVKKCRHIFQKGVELESRRSTNNLKGKARANICWLHCHRQRSLRKKSSYATSFAALDRKIDDALSIWEESPDFSHGPISLPLNPKPQQQQIRYEKSPKLSRFANS